MSDQETPFHVRPAGEAFAAPVPPPPPEPVASAHPGPADPSRFLPPTRAHARAKRQEERDGYWMPLDKTGGHLLVVPVSAADANTLIGLPSAAKETVLRVFREFNEVKAAESGDEFEKNLERLSSLADAICLVAVKRPRLVATEADLGGDPEALVVTDLHIEERVKVLNFCMGRLGAEELKRIEPFRRAGVGGVGAVPADQAT